MTIWNNIIHYSVYRRMILSYICLVVMTVFLISTVSFQLFSYNTAMEISDMSESMLAQTSFSSDIIYEQVLIIGSHLLTNPTVIRSMNMSNINYLFEYHTILELSNVIAAYPFISYIGIFNGNTENYINSKGISIESDRDVIN